MLEGIIADVLVRVLGSYVDGLNRESIRVGVWRGDLELNNLRIRPDALAILFETLGLDLPVTVTAGYIGHLRLEVPWKALRSSPVRIFMRDVNVVASPVSDGDQSALELRERRLKAARLATDEAVRDAKFSVRSELNSQRKNSSESQESADPLSNDPPSQSGGYLVTRWGWRFTRGLVTRIVDNIQIIVENVIVQYEDASSVRDNPYTATLAFDSLHACSTDLHWNSVFIDKNDSPLMQKVLHARGLVLNWEPGNNINDLRTWILDSNSPRTPGHWSGLAREASRHAIRPMDGECRIALIKASALASAIAGTSPKLDYLKTMPRVQIDISFPDVHIALDDFQYHTLLSTIMYLSDIDRKVRPKTARGRWFWALDRLLPRFKERHEAAKRFNAEGLRQRRELRERYCKARNILVKARRNGQPEPSGETRIVEQVEAQLSINDIVHFRDLADKELYSELQERDGPTSIQPRFWSLFSRSTNVSAKDRSSSPSLRGHVDPDLTTESSHNVTYEDFPRSVDNHNNMGTVPANALSNEIVDAHDSKGKEKIIGKVDKDDITQDGGVPGFRMGFLLGCGAIELRRGGFSAAPVPLSSLEFRELRFGLETRPDSGFLIEALLGTFEVIDLHKDVKVMYQRAPWAGEKCAPYIDDSDGGCNIVDVSPVDKSKGVISHYAEDWIQDNLLEEKRSKESSDSVSFAPVLPSYPHDIANALAEIRGEFGIGNSPISFSSPRFNSYRSSMESGSSSSLSTMSECGMSNSSAPNREDLSIITHAPLKYIAALRLNQEEASDGDWARGATRMAMDLAIGGMEVIIDGSESAFVSSVKFWHPREKTPSIMQFLTRAAAPRLASLRMNLQKALLERSVPMRMDLLIRGPRFVFPGPPDQEVSILVDFGTFAMETSIGPSEPVPREFLGNQSSKCRVEEDVPKPEIGELSVRYTQYKMACTDLGLYVVSEAGRHAAERVVKPFSVHLLLEVLHNSSFIEAMTLTYRNVNITKVKLQGKLPSLRTSVSHHAFHQILDIVRSNGQTSGMSGAEHVSEPSGSVQAFTLAAEMEEFRQSQDPYVRQLRSRQESIRSPLILFEMSLDLEDLQLELRDLSYRRIVTISSTGTHVQMRQRFSSVNFEYRVRSFTVVDGSRGATAPFRQLAYAGIDNTSSSVTRHCDGSLLPSCSKDCRSFISLSYHGDSENLEQVLRLKILSLNMVCVRESYFALADFFYLKGEGNGSNLAHGCQEFDQEQSSSFIKSGESDEPEYSDPFSALGMTTSGAAKALRVQAGRGVEISKQAIANRGRITVTADLDGLGITLVTAEGAIACFDVKDCKTHLTQYSNGAIHASGDLGGFGVKDLTSAFDVYSETIRYDRQERNTTGTPSHCTDGWSLTIPSSEGGDIYLKAYLRNMRIVYLHRFIIILKKYFDVLRQSLRPVIEMKGGLGEVFETEHGEDFPAFPTRESRVNLSIVTDNVDIVMPRHSQSPYEALRFYVPHSSISNVPIVAPGYELGFNVQADGIDAYVLYQSPAKGEGRALTEGGTEPVLRHIVLNDPIENLVPFSRNISIVAKLDLWRRRRVPQVILNSEGLPVLKDGEEEREYDPAKWLPAIRVRVSMPNGVTARLCEAEYSILYFTFTENVIERPDIQFTDLVRGLKTPVLPVRRPVQPIMFSSNKMPPNYQIMFEVPSISSVIMSGAHPRDERRLLIRSELRDLVGCFEYGVDYRMTIEVNANMDSLTDIRPGVPSHGKTLIMPVRNNNGQDDEQERLKETEMTRSVTFTWDRPFGFRTNVMIVASNLRVIIEPELFRDLGCLTAPGFPYLKSSAPPPLLKFNGRLLILTVSRPEIWLMANQYPGDGRSLVIRGEIIAKVQWAAVTGRQMVEVAARGIHINLSNVGPSYGPIVSPQLTPSSRELASVLSMDRKDIETPMLYPCDISTRFDESGYDPPECVDGEPIKVSLSHLSLNAESFLVRIDVNDTPLILAVGSRLVLLNESELSRRPVQPGRFDQWIDKGDDIDGKLAVHFMLPNGRLIFTDENAGRYVPIMEARIRNLILKSNVPWLTNAAFEFALELFNDEKGWWEPGVEMFPVEIATSEGRSGSRAIHVHTDRNIDINLTPNTLSGAARVVKSLKAAIIDLSDRLRHERRNVDEIGLSSLSLSRPPHIQNLGNAQRPSVAAFCVRNETGRTMVLWLPYDSKRRPLHGEGGEVEVDPPSEEILWSAMGANIHGFISTDPNKNRKLSMSCIISLSGYIPVTLSTSQVGTWLVSLKPDLRDLASPAATDKPLLTALKLVWSVVMRDGVPFGCIRSVLRIINRTRTVLEVSISGLRKTGSIGNMLKTITGNSVEESREPRLEMEHEPHSLIKSGESWSIPAHAIHRAIRIRPVILNAPDSESTSDRDSDTSKGRVYHAFKWSEPLSKISTLHDIGRELSVNHAGDTPILRTASTNIGQGPALTCRAENGRHVFTMMLQPKIDCTVDWQSVGDREVPGWVDICVCSPLVLENLLPRSMYYKFAIRNVERNNDTVRVVDEGLIEPLREAHIHSVGSNLGNVALAVGVDNSSHSELSSEHSRISSVQSVGDFLPNLSSISQISMGTGRYKPFTLMLDQDKTASTRYIQTFCKFWIRNRSDIDLFFRDRDNNDSKQISIPKTFLRRRPPGTPADKYVCFSGRRLSFQKAAARENVWVNVGTEVCEIDKPVPLQFEGISLLLEVRPAKGKLQRSLIATVRNAVWIENRTGSVIQWCQPASLNAQGIALASRVHHVKRGEVKPLHWDFNNRKKAICLRRSGDDGFSEWIWSRPVSMDGVEGEFVAKMYRPKHLEQYIARVVITKLRHGVLGVVIHKEDRNTPPYRIVNNCVGRSIAFKQSGVHETHPWLVRPGKSSRYSWDDPQAPVKKRALVVEVIEHTNIYKNFARSGMGSLTSAGPTDNIRSLTERELSMPSAANMSREIRYQKFDLNIDMISRHVGFPHSSRFDPPLAVSVHVDGPTKVVTFSDGLQEVSSRRPLDSDNGVSRNENRSVDAIEHATDRKEFKNLDIEIFVNALGISFVDSAPIELAYLSVSGIHFRLDRFDNQQLITCDVQDLQLDNQLLRCPWPVVIWSPPPNDSRWNNSKSAASTATRPTKKPFFQLIIDGPYPSISQGIGNFRGIFVALQQLQIAADEDFVLRMWLFAASLIDSIGGSDNDKNEPLDSDDGLELGVTLCQSDFSKSVGSDTIVPDETQKPQSLKQLYVEQLDLCPLKLTVSFTSSRTSTAAERIGGFRSLMRTLVAVLGNVENAEFRFNALELSHVFDSISHFRSLITEFYVTQGSNQKIVLLASNSLIGNPSALFDSIAIGTRDFFVEPANAKGSADFIASIGRGSSSLLTNTVGGLVGSIGAIPRAVAQGLESAVGDRDYLAERDSIRGGRARAVSSPAQGFVTGALSFGHGIASAAAGLIRDPIQGAAEEGASGFIKGLGKGVVGGVLKPLTGVLDLIAEPAAGFRSMMVSDGRQKCAEPVRPPRAFWGAHGAQMTSYNLRDALGQAVLEVVNGRERTDERLVSWTYLVDLHHNASDAQVVSFLWALLRRSTRSSLQGNFLLDAQGKPQQANKMRAALITTKRLIITSLDGHVLWECPSTNIVDTQVSLEAKDFLMVGVRPVGHRLRSAVAPVWEKIHCGSMAAKDELNSSLRKVIQERQLSLEALHGHASFVRPPSRVRISDERYSTADPSKSVRPFDEKCEMKGSRNARDDEPVDRSVVEMSDLSNVGVEGDLVQSVELKSLHYDTSADGKRGVFTNTTMPGRGEKTTVSGNGVGTTAFEPLTDLSYELTKAISDGTLEFASGAPRSVCIFIVNELNERLYVRESNIESGTWIKRPPNIIEGLSVERVEADCGDDRVQDILGSIILSREENDVSDLDDVCAVRFLNPLLAANAFAISNTAWLNGSFKGGRNGDKVVTVLTLKSGRGSSQAVVSDVEKRNVRSAAEPLLFGRSDVGTLAPSVTFEPPREPKKNVDLEDSELIRKLASLGFNEKETRMALQECNADMSAAYAMLLEQKSINHMM